VEADKGTNLFFAIYESKTEDGKCTRSFVSVPLRMVIDCKKTDIKHWKQELDKTLHKSNLVPETAKPIALLSPGDLVYVPTMQEITNGVLNFNKNQIYKVVSFDTPNCYFVPHYVASSVIDKAEFTRHNKIPRVVFIDGDNRLIREYCIPIQVDRLGNIL
jgi:CRISPR-associated endonuclease Csn1